MIQTLLAGSLLFPACGAPSEQPTAAPSASGSPAAAVPKSPVSINATMVRVVDHAAHRLWDVERDEMKPKTDADWETLEEHATQLAATGALIQLEGTGVNDRDWVQQADWQKWSKAVSDAGMTAFKAAEARSLQGVIDANGQLVDACLGCHNKFKPTLPSEGIVHSHVH